MPCNGFFYPSARIDSSMRLHFRTPEEELTLEAFVHETVASAKGDTRLSV